MLYATNDVYIHSCLLFDTSKYSKLLLTFKAKITSDYTTPADANFDISGRFALTYPNSDRVDFIQLDNEIFEFSKTRILFSPSQKNRFGNNLYADIISLNCQLRDNTYYSLLPTTIDDKTVYLIKFGDTNPKSRATLHLDSINRFLLTLIHYKTLRHPAITWLDFLKLLGWIIVTMLLLIQTINGCNERNSKSTQPSSSTDTLNKKSQEKGGSLKDTTNSFRIDTSHSYPLQIDTTEQKTQIK